MKRRKTLNRLLAMLLTLILCAGELSATGLKVFAADDAEAAVSGNDALSVYEISENDTGEDLISENAPGENAVTDNDEKDATEAPDEEIAVDDMADPSAEEEEAESEGTEEEELDEDPASEEDAGTEEGIIIVDGDAGSEEITADKDADSFENTEITPDGSGEDFQKTADNTMFGNVGMVNPRVPNSVNDEWQGSYVYYGKYNGKAVKYRVLDKSTSGEYSLTNTMLLDCDSVLYDGRMSWDAGDINWNSGGEKYDNGIDHYIQTIIRTNLNGEWFSNSFTRIEGSRIVKSTKKEKSVKDANKEYPESDYLVRDRIFILANIEAERESYGYASNARSRVRQNQQGDLCLWLRSKDSYSATKSIVWYKAINSEGKTERREAWREYAGVCPAFNVKTEDILFSTAVMGAKGQLGTEYKLTLRAGDDSYMKVQLPSSKKATVTGKNVSVPFSLTGTNATDASVSVMILNRTYQWGYMNDVPIRYYGKLEGSGDFTTNGVGSFTLPSDLDVNNWGSSYHVYLIPEDINGEHETDYAGEPYEITKDMVSIDNSVTVTFDLQGHGNANSSYYQPRKVDSGSAIAEPVEPSESGYAFKGWYTSVSDHSSSNEYDFSTPVNGNITLYAYWVKTYAVSFDLTEHPTRSGIEPQYVEEGQKATRPETFKVSGYEVVDWYTAKTRWNYQLYDFDTPVTADITLYASWKDVSNCKVTFDLNASSGIGPGTLYVATGSKVAKPDNPSNSEGWVFGGWYTDKACSAGKEYDFNAAVNEDMTLYAKWTDKLNLWVNGVQLGKDNLSTGDWTYTSKTNVLDLKNVTFEKTHIEDNNTIMMGSYAYVAYVYAKGIPLKVTGKGLTSSSAKTSSNIAGILVEDAPLTVDADLELTGTGAGICAKNVTIEGGRINISSSASVEKVDLGRGRTYTKTPYGIYGHDSVTINGGDVNINMSGNEAIGIRLWYGDIDISGGSLKVSVNGSKSSRAVDAMQGGINNSLYYVTPAGGKVDASGHFFTDAYGDEAYEIELAGEDSLMRTVSFDLNGKPGTAPAPQVLMKGKKATAPAAPETPGYTFKGWYTNADCKDEDRYYFDTGVTENITLYAGWEEIIIPRYIVSFDLKGHGGAIAAVTVNEGESVTKPIDPIEAGYVFKGWYTDEECSDAAKYDFADKVYANFTLYAKWSKIETFTAEFNLSGHGDAIASQSVTEGGTVTKPADPVASGFTFKGWYLDAECTSPYDFNTKLHSDVTLYACWVKDGDTVYTVSFIMGGYGKSIPSQVVAKGKKATMPADPVDASRVFAGWYADAGFTEGFDFDKAITADTSVYARWEPIDPDGFYAYFAPGTSLSYNDGSGRYEHVYTGSKITPGIVVEDCGGRTLKEGKDYTVKYSNNQNVDKKGKPAVVTITGKGRYKNSKKLNFYILTKSLGNGMDATPAAGIYMDDFVLTSGSKAAPVIYYMGKKLGSKDFTLKSKTGDLKFTDADDVADRKISIYGKGNFSGCIFEAPVSLVSRDELKATTINVSLSNVKCVYNGTAWKLTDSQLIVKDGAKNVLAPDKYKVVYTDNMNAGTAKVTVSGINGYTGTFSKTFKIEPDKNLSVMKAIPGSDPVYYTPEGAGPKITVTADRDGVTKTLQEGKDYKVSYSGNRKATDKAKYTVSFIGNYKGQKNLTGTYKINAAPFEISRLKVNASDLVYKKPGKYLSAPDVMYDGVLLKKSDYTVVYKISGEDISKANYTLTGSAASVDVTITGKGNYANTSVTISCCYTIRTAPAGAIDLSKAKITMKGDMKKKVPTQEYSGKELKPEFDLYIKSGNAWMRAEELGLILGTDYAVTYINNTDKGNAYILVDSLSSSVKCVGHRKEQFKILQKSFGGLQLLFKL